MDLQEIRKWYEIFKNGHELVEVRAWEGKKVYSGYFQDADTLINAVRGLDACAIYFTLNEINSACASRSQINRMQYNVTSTSDNDIVRRKWILLDFDPKRPSDTNSTDEEKKKAKVLAKNVAVYLRSVGFPWPVFCDSANGWHLLYRVEMENTKDNTEVVENFLKVVAMMFNDGVTDVDTAVFNPSRICKLYGTFSRKGADTAERPQRQSRIYQVPSTIEIVPIGLLKKVAGELPRRDKPSWQNNYNRDKFDIDGFIQKYGIEVAKELPFGNGGRKLVLKECPFDSNHKAPDSAIFVMSDGALGFKCFHNSCSNYSWRDLREKFEPKAFRVSYDTNRTTRPLKSSPTAQNEGVSQVLEPKGEEWLKFDEIKNVDRNQIVSMPSGFKPLDDRIIGFNKKEVTVWSGSNASGKSSLLNTIMLNAVQIGYKCAIWSGELPAPRLKNWIVMAAAGKNHTLQSKYGNAWYVPADIVEVISKWLSDKVYIYNNDYGNRYDVLLESIRKKITESGIDEVVIDNLMALNIGDGKDKLEQQKRFILDVVALARLSDVHIHLVCHPRKSVGFLRKTDISGTADLTNAVDNVLIVHRVNKDFKRGIEEFYDRYTREQFEDFGNVIEVCKNRDLGVSDYLVGLYYEIESKRFKDDLYEKAAKYGWEEVPQQNTIEFNDEIKNFEKDGDLPE